MNTISDRNVRTYYETVNINVPTMTEPTYEQGLLGNGNTYTDHTRTTQQTHPADTDHETETTTEHLRTEWERLHKETQQKGTYTKDDTDKMLSIIFQAATIFTNSLTDTNAAILGDATNEVMLSIIRIAEAAERYWD